MCGGLFAIVVVCVVDERGDEGSLEHPGPQQQPALDQLLPLHVRVVTEQVAAQATSYENHHTILVTSSLICRFMQNSQEMCYFNAHPQNSGTANAAP